MSVSVLVLTLNEEINLSDCLASLAWSDDVVVLDSGSTDDTVAIARRCGARVVTRAFDNWASHQNWAVSNIAFTHPWVLYLDADERCPPELAEEVRRRATATAPESAFRVRRKDFFMGRWLRRAQLYPTWLVRLFRPERIRYERVVNPVATVEGSISALDAHVLHYPFSHGVSHWVARHNRYSDLEAVEARKLLAARAGSGASVWSGDPNLRRQALKEVFTRVPARPLVKWAYYVFWRRAFLDGRAGMTYATLQAIYEYLIVCKTRELERRARGEAL